MNERIRELAEQADIFINKSNCVESGNGTEIIGWHIEKLAELIIQDLIDSMIKRYGDDDELPIEEIKLFVKEYFGVKE